MYTNELRCYTFTLAQLNTMQQGIQAAHAIVELGMKTYRKQMIMRDGTNWTMYHTWAIDWKTMVFLNGGDGNELLALENFFYDSQNMLPWAPFYEDESLYGSLTSMAIILPERIFKTAETLRKNGAPEGYPQRFTSWELQLIRKLADARRAV